MYMEVRNPATVILNSAYRTYPIRAKKPTLGQHLNFFWVSCTVPCPFSLYGASVHRDGIDVVLNQRGLLEPAARI